MDQSVPWTITRPSDELVKKLRKAHFIFSIEWRDAIVVYPPAGWRIEIGSRMNSIFDEKGDIRFIDFLGKDGYDPLFSEVRPAREVQKELDELRKRTVLTTGLDFGHFMELARQFPTWSPDQILRRMQLENAFLKPRRTSRSVRNGHGWMSVTSLRQSHLPETTVRRVD